MKNHIFVSLLTSLLLMFFSSTHSQDYQPKKGYSSFSKKVSFEEIVAYDKAHPEQATPKKKTHNDEDDMIFIKSPIDQSNVIYKAPYSVNTSYLPVTKSSPEPDADFLGLDDAGTSIPPDVNGTVGLEHLMVTLNTEFRIMDKEGNEISTVSSGNFWGGTPGANGVFDPKISYDLYENRWFLIQPSYNGSLASSRLMVAVSENWDPTGNWYFYTFDADSSNLHWFDYPDVGFNKNWIVATGNMIENTPQYHKVFVFNKEDLYNGSLLVEYTEFIVEDNFSLIPAFTYDEDEEDIYMVNTADGNNDGFGYINLWRIYGGVGNETLENVGLIGVPEPWADWSYFENDDFAPQLGSEHKLNTVDARMQNMVFRNGKLWCVHHIYLPADEPTRSSIQWWELDTTGTVLQRGRVDDTTGVMFYTYATIAVNAKEDIMVGYGSFSEEQYASGSYSMRYADDPPNTMMSSYQYIDGLAPYYKTFSGDKNRWGDYTATWIDPVDQLDFWTLQEYADLPSGGSDHWGVWWAYVNIDSKPQALFSSSTNEVPIGSEVDFYDESMFAPTNWLWIFEGGYPESITEQNPQGIYYGTSGFYDVTLIATNDLGSDTLLLEDYIEVNTTILPEVYFVANDSVPCLGKTVIFEDQTIYNPISWNWSFDPDDISFVNGTDMNSQYPEVNFNSAGKYSVTLNAENSNGSSSFSKEEYIIAGGLSIPFIENFEAQSLTHKGWEVDNPDDLITWDLEVTYGLDEGFISAYMDIFNYTVSTGPHDGLISPVLNFSNFSEVHLSFQHAYARRLQNITDSLNIYISNDCGDNWEKVFELYEDGSGVFQTQEIMFQTRFVPQDIEDWCGFGYGADCYTVDLSEWSGQENIRIKFDCYSFAGNNLYLDDIVIGPTVSVVKSNPENLIQIYPNPTTGIVNMVIPESFSNYHVCIYNSQGAVIFETDGISKDNLLQLDINEFPKGLYHIKIQNKENTEVHKLILK